MSMATDRNDSAWIRRFQPAPDAPVRLVCFPHAGGSASFYLPVARQLAPDLDVLAVQYPGRQERRQEPCVESIEALADLVVLQLRPWADRPLALFGHSMGAALGFEVARRLERDGTAPVCLFASGRRAPSRVREESIHQADDEVLISEISRLSGTDSRLLGDPELLSMVLPAIRGDYKAVETYRYRPGPVLTCPVTVLVGDTDPHVTLAEAQAWQVHTGGGFQLQVFTGGHFYLNQHAGAVMRAITENIAAVRPIG